MKVAMACLPPLRALRHVVWDWNGTLLDDARVCVEVMAGMLARRGLAAMPLERYQEIFRFPVRAYYEDLGFDFARESWEVVGTEFIEGYQARQGACRLQGEALAALAAFDALAVSQSVLSASQRSRLLAQAQTLGVQHRFTALLGLDDHFAGSKVELGRRWVAQLGFAPDQVLLIGDTDHDFEVARAMGVHCALVTCGHQSEERLRALGPPVFPSLGALVDLWPAEDAA